MKTLNEIGLAQDKKQMFTTFYIGQELFGVDILKVEEVTGEYVVFPVPRSPNFVQGLVNLRGQIVTSIDLRELFGSGSGRKKGPMSVVCRLDGALFALNVDAIGDVVEIDRRYFEQIPETVPYEQKRYLQGIYKINGHLISLLDVEFIAKGISPSN